MPAWVRIRCHTKMEAIPFIFQALGALIIDICGPHVQVYTPVLAARSPTQLLNSSGCI